jgi:GTP cyclohydrolase I
MRTDRQTGMSKLKVTFHNFAKAPKVQNVLRAHVALTMNSETMKQAEHWASATDSPTK